VATRLASGQPAVRRFDPDDATAAYIVETRPAFDDLRQVLSLLAGLLVLEASGASEEAAGHPMLTSAREMLEHAADAIRQARPTRLSARHHRLLLVAASTLDTALREAATTTRRGRPDGLDKVLCLIQDGHASLRAAGDELPGFELVALGQACCAIGQQGGVSDQVTVADRSLTK